MSAPPLGFLRKPKPYKFIGFGDSYGPKPYKFIGFGDDWGDLREDTSRISALRGHGRISALRVQVFRPNFGPPGPRRALEAPGMVPVRKIVKGRLKIIPGGKS